MFVLTKVSVSVCVCVCVCVWRVSCATTKNVKTKKNEKNEKIKKKFLLLHTQRCLKREKKKVLLNHMSRLKIVVVQMANCI